MHKKRVNSVSSKAKSKNKSKSLAEHHKAYISMAVSAVILILAVIFVYPMIGDQGVVGQAWKSESWDAPYTEDFYWEVAPTIGYLNNDAGGCTNPNYQDIETDLVPSVNDVITKGCCIGSNKHYCMSPYNPVAKVDPTCYHENSFFLGTYLCFNHDDDQDLDILICTEGDGGFHGKEVGEFTCDGEKQVWSIGNTKPENEVDGTECLEENEGKLDIIGQYYCDQTLWKKCSSKNEGDSKGGYICSSNKWTKCANDAKLLDDKYYCYESNWETCQANYKSKISIDKTHYCDGDSWEVCDNVDYKTTSDGVYACFEDTWETCTAELEEEGELIDSSKKVCYNFLWNICDEDNTDNIGTITPSFQYHCEQKELLSTVSWSNIFQFSDGGFYEVLLNDKKKTIEINPTYFDIHVCDKGTENVADIATICYKESEAGEEKTKPIESISRIQKGGEFFIFDHSKLDKVDDLLILYENEIINLDEKKEIKTFLIKDITKAAIGHPVKLPFGEATFNFVNERRLALKFGNEYYLVSHPAEAFKLEKLKLTKLPYLQELTIQSIGNQYQFIDEDTDKAINFYYDGINLQILPGLPGQMAAAFISPKNLEKNFEFFFTTNIPISLENSGDLIFDNANITVCNQDKAGDIQVLQVCVNEVEAFTLDKDELVIKEINGKEVAFLYQYNETENQKTGYVFLVKEVKSGELDLDYSNFVDSMIKGRRLAVKFGNGLYLLEHPVSILSLPKLNLVGYTETGQTPYPALGSEKKVEFSIAEGKIILERDYLQPPPPFKIHGLTQQQILDIPLNLEDNLSTSMSNQVSIKVTNPPFGIISVDEDDLTAYDASFKITTANGNYKLNYQIPRQIGPNSLFYYFSASIKEDQFVKTAKIYYLYNINKEKSLSHDFNDQFIQTFTGGNELAIYSEGFFYLLGYEGANSGGKSFFSLDKLTLRLLNGTEEEFTGNVDFATQSVTFPVLKGELSVIIDDDANTITFSSKGAETLITEDFDTHSTLLTTENKVSIYNTNYEICDTPDTELNEEVVLLCQSSGGLYLLKKNQPNEDILKKDKLFWYQGSVNGEKTIKISDVENIELKAIPFPSWADLVNNVNEDKSKVYKWQNQLFELSGGSKFGLSGGDKLSSYSLKTVPGGNLYPLKNLKSSPEGLENGTFVYNEHLLIAKQEWDNDFKIKLTLIPKTHKLLSGAGMNISESGTTFAYSLEAPLYVLKYQIFGNVKNLLRITLIESDNPNSFYSSLFVSGTEKDVLLTSGDKLNIKFNATSDFSSPLIIIKK